MTRRREDSGLGAVGLAVAGALAVSVLLLVALVLVRGGGNDEPRTSAVTSAPLDSPVTSPSTIASAPAGGDRPTTVSLVLEPYDVDRFSSVYPAVGNLEDGSVLWLDLSGFVADTTGTIQQCIYAGGEQRSCGNSFPVNFNGDGRARVQYQVSSNVAPAVSSCAGHVRPCSVVVEDVDGHQAMAVTVFGGPLPPAGEITVTPAGGLRTGDEVEVRVTGYPPGAQVSAVQCSPPGEWGPLTCDGPGAGASMTVGADGTAQTVVEVTDGRLGRDGGSCPPAAGCGISVASDDVWARAPVVPLEFAKAGARYDVGRTAMALVICGALLGVALGLWRRTDWSGPTEAATPDLDRARLE
jgi:hypothetical protein